MKKFISIIILLIIPCIAFSQKTEDVILNDNEFKALAKKATEFYTSEAYINFEKNREEFSEKVGRSFYPEGSLEPEKYKSWIKENLDKTNFTSLEEGLSVYYQYYNSILTKPNEKEITSLLFKLDEKYGSDTFRPIFTKYVLSEVFIVWDKNGINP
ncbi:hypothetical protein MG290_07800 [Flavobacterium sp. CBA20B-1]|uniref:hypothetical protein n=1 Tax=unclassified Flavobacterium TaxID=196869 RepID=UPI0022254047|nr:MULTISPECIES: hypothetical protein [unclassified Flavobacterium]WCM40880.1 hypothetical protein MG290_07800 [Flavobacterium sp. CBA20B-1]